MRVFICFLLVCAATAYAAHEGQKRVLVNDKKGEFKIYDVESAVTSFAQGGGIDFEASGSPLRGFSKQQGLVFSAKNLEGTADRTVGGPLRLRRANASGDVLVDTEASVSGGGGSSSHIESSALTIEEKDATTVVTFEHAFQFSNHFVATGTDRTVALRAPSGEFVLPLMNQSSGSSNPFQSANVKGPVQIDIDSSQKAGEGTAKWKINLKSDSLTYSATDRVMRMTGNVVGDVESDPTSGEPFGFNVNADWMHVTFDESGAVKTIKSGIGTVKSKGGEQ